MLKKLIHTLTLLAFLAGLFLASPPSPAHAATLTVNTLTDENDGSCLDGDCSLRDAIQVAADNDTITFSVTGTITLTAALTVNKSLTITGPGSAQLTLDGNNLYQIFILSNDTPTNTINISGMTMTKGYADPTVVCGGGAIRSWAFLTMDDVVVTNNHAPSNVTCVYPRGGGILFFDSAGSLTLTNSTVSYNSSAYGGGGIFFGASTGNISLNNVIVDHNQTTNADGGGVEINDALSTVTITNSTFSNNDALGSSGAEGGGLKISTTSTTPAVTIQNSLFSSNTAYDGGGIYIFKLPVTITNSTIADNSASSDGGGLYNFIGTVTINSSTIKGNIVSGGGTSEGGGIYNLGSVNLTGSITIVNSTLTGNSSSGKGGAIFNLAAGNTVTDIATINIYNSTIVGNSAANSLGGGGIVTSRSGGNEFSSITLSNSIVYGNTLTTGTGGENCVVINSMTIVTNNHNLFENLAQDCSPGVNDVTSNLTTPSVVNALASNGGATQTMSLPNGSPAIDTGSNSVCALAPVSNTSQNGVPRPQGGTCDIGAFELLVPLSSSTFKSNAANDGWILEASEASDTGGTLNSNQKSFILGDDAADRQYRTILHFDTSALPDTAVVTNMTLKVKQQSSVTGTSPFSFGSLYVDMRNPAFGNSILELVDFNFAAKKVKSAVFNPNPVSGWFSARFNNGGNLYVNRTGTSQLRLYFSVDDNDNNIADFIRFYSGNAAAGDRPKLLVQYYVP